MKKIDVHLHSLETSLTFGNQRLPTPADLINDIYKQLDVEKGILLPISEPGEDELSRLDEKCELANQRAYQLTQKYPDLLDWYCYMDPRMGKNSPETDFSEYLSRYKQMGAKGVGELTANLYFDDPLYENLFAHCEKLDMPILFHMSPKVGVYGIIDELGLPRLEKMLKKFPNLNFIGHSQIFWSEISADVTEDTRGDYPVGQVTPGRVVELMRNYPNLYGEFSANSGFNALDRDHTFAYAFIEEFQDRLMYGTDYAIPREGIDLSGFLDQSEREGKISKEAYVKVIRTNAQKLLKLV